MYWSPSSFQVEPSPHPERRTHVFIHLTFRMCVYLQIVASEAQSVCCILKGQFDIFIRFLSCVSVQHEAGARGRLA